MVTGGRGSLRLALPLDYEVMTSYNITLVAYDLGTPPVQRSTSTIVRVRVQDVDEVVPHFTQTVYSIEAPHTLPVGAVVIRVPAGRANTQLLYRIIGGGGHTIEGSGHFVGESGHIVGESSHTICGSGHIIDGSGPIVGGSGQTIDGSGHIVGVSDHIVSWFGHAIYGSGHIVGESGKIGHILGYITARLHV